MDFSWTKALWKGIKTAAIAGLGVFAASFFGAFDEVGEWLAFGAPEWIALVAIIGVDALRNFIKQWLKSLEGQL